VVVVIAGPAATELKGIIEINIEIPVINVSGRILDMPSSFRMGFQFALKKTS
jgi:hypothetical protein